MRFLIIRLCWLAGLLVVGGCATAPRFDSLSVLPDDGRNPEALQRAKQVIAHVFPPPFSAVQRAIISVAGRQFTCDGLLKSPPSSTEGWHLVIVSSFGTVTDLRVQPDGGTELLKVTPLFRSDWSRDYVARDLRWLFMPPPELQSSEWLPDGRPVWQTTADTAGISGEYIFSANGSQWEELDLRKAGKTFYRVRIKHYLTFPDMIYPMPDVFQVDAEHYQMELHLVNFKMEGRQ